MITIGKTAAVAIAAMSCLAEHWSTGGSLSAPEIGRLRDYSGAHVAKVLTQLSALGLVSGVRGPGGGYRLGREPGSISIAEVLEPFEGKRSLMACPFGPNWCGHGEPCPLHDHLVQLKEHNMKVMEAATLALFVKQ